MDEHDVLAERFEAHRARLRAIAYQTLGSTSEADDASARGPGRHTDVEGDRTLNP
jgi:hypothetical protein